MAKQAERYTEWKDGRGIATVGLRQDLEVSIDMTGELVNVEALDKIAFAEGVRAGRWCRLWKDGRIGNSMPSDREK